MQADAHDDFDGERPGDWEPADTSWFGMVPLPRRFFHCAPQSARADIAVHGLDPARCQRDLVQDEGLRAQIGERAWPPAIYLWATLSDAQTYAKGWSLPCGPRPAVAMDIYEIDTDHLSVEPDPLGSDPRLGARATYKLDLVDPQDMELVGCVINGEMLPNTGYSRCLHSVRVKETIDNALGPSYWDELNMGSLDPMVDALPQSISDADLSAIAVICLRLERAPLSRADLLDMLDRTDMALRHRLEQELWTPQPLPGQISLFD